MAAEGRVGRRRRRRRGGRGLAEGGRGGAVAVEMVQVDVDDPLTDRRLPRVGWPDELLERIDPRGGGKGRPRRGAGGRGGLRGGGRRGGQLVVPADDQQGDVGGLPPEPLGGVLERFGDAAGQVVAVGHRRAGLERRRDAASETRRRGRHGAGLSLGWVWTAGNGREGACRVVGRRGALIAKDSKSTLPYGPSSLT